MIQPPNGTSQMENLVEEKKNKAREIQKSIDLLFKKLKMVCEELESASGFETAEGDKLIPYKDSSDISGRVVKDEKSINPSIIEERNQLLKTLDARNEHLKAIIGNLRNLIWDINTMLAMKRP